MQLLLNDKNAPGGSTALDPIADEGSLGSYNFAIVQRCFDAINKNFAELYALAGQQLVSSNLTAFTTSIPLNGNYQMPPQAVTSQLTFTAAGGASVESGTLMSGCDVDLVADGVSGHVPVFSGFTVTGEWNNAAGVVNRCKFCYDGSNYTIGIWQGSANFPLNVPVTAPAVTSISLVHGANPVLVLGIGGSGLDPGYIPPISAFSVSGADGVQLGNGETAWNQIGVTSNSVHVPLSGSVAAGDVITVNYVPPTTSVRTATGALQDDWGVRLAALTAASVTAS